MNRNQVVQAIEANRVVAVIRMKEADRLRAVVDAIAEGGVRAMEVTMTVPGAVDLIRQLAPVMPAGFLLGAAPLLDSCRAAELFHRGAPGFWPSAGTLGPFAREDVPNTTTVGCGGEAWAALVGTT